MTPPAALVHAANLGVAVKDRVILQGIDLEVRAGDRVGLVGPSGSGKSTLARALVGLEAVSGSLRVAGVELVGAAADVRRGWQRRVQLCWQDATSALDPLRSVRQILGDARALAGRGEWDDAQMVTALGVLELPPTSLDANPRRLSGGQRQRVALARALAAEPELLLADEVTSALDPPLAWAMIDHIVRWSDETGGTAVIVAHDVALLCKAVHHVVVLDGGRIVEQGPPAKVLGSPDHEVTRTLVRAVPHPPE